MTNDEFKATIAALKVGDEVAERTARQGRFQFYGYTYKYTTVKRITKTRIVVHAEGCGPKNEREYTIPGQTWQTDLIERGGAHNPLVLIIGSDQIKKIRDDLAAEKARTELEMTAVAALVALDKAFHGRTVQRASQGEGVESRSYAEIKFLETVAALFSAVPESSAERLEALNQAATVLVAARSLVS